MAKYITDYSTIEEEVLQRSAEKIKQITPLIHQIILCEIKMEYTIGNQIHDELEKIQDWVMETIKEVLIRERLQIPKNKS